MGDLSLRRFSDALPVSDRLFCGSGRPAPVLEDKVRFDRRHGQSADKGVRIGGEGRGPLRGVLFIPPAGRMGLDIAGAGVFKSHRVRRLEHPRVPFSAPLLDRIKALDTHHAQDLSRPARVGKRDNVGAARARIARAVGGAMPIEP